VYAVGPGRGSGAGSLVLYLLGVTDVDPIRHDLLFSRFLSENRGSQAVLKFSQA
jgi:DNA polymerase-3 subunit alpha